MVTFKVEDVVTIRGFMPEKDLSIILSPQIPLVAISFCPFVPCLHLLDATKQLRQGVHSLQKELEKGNRANIGPDRRYVRIKKTSARLLLSLTCYPHRDLQSGLQDMCHLSRSQRRFSEKDKYLQMNKYIWENMLL